MGRAVAAQNTQAECSLSRGSSVNGLIRTLLFTSALAPAVLVSATLRWSRAGADAEVLAWIAASALACVLPILVVKGAERQLATMPFAAKKVESQDWFLVVFVASYFVPLVARVDDLYIFAAVFLIAGVILATLEAVPCHPVLHAMRYRFYKVEGANGTVYTFISRRRLLAAADITLVRQLSPQLLMDAQ